MEFFWDILIGTGIILAGMTIIGLVAIAITDALQRYYDRGK